MTSTVVVGGFFGDEGKGKIISYLAIKDNPSIIVRGGAGPNAGHTIRDGNKVYKVRMLPSGFLNKNAKVMIGPGVVINPEILKKRMMEFFSLSKSDQKEVINNALEAGPTIPFPNFSKLFRTWLKILTTLSEEQREGLFSAYITEVAVSPQKLISFNLDGILEVFLTLEENEKEILANTVKKIINDLDGSSKRKIMLVIPDNAKIHLKF